MLSYRSRREMNPDEPTPCSTATVEPEWKSRIPLLESFGGPELDKHLHIHLHHGTFQFLIKTSTPPKKMGKLVSFIPGLKNIFRSWPVEFFVASIAPALGAAGYLLGQRNERQFQLEPEWSTVTIKNRLV